MTASRRAGWGSYTVAILGGWTLIGLLFTPQTYLANQSAPVSLPWWMAVAVTLTNTYVWAVLTPPVIWLGNRFPIGRTRVVPRFLLHFAASLVFAIVHLLVLGQVNQLLFAGHAPPAPPVPMAAVVASVVTTNVMFYWSITILGHALTYFRRYQERELTLVQAQLQSLRAQLHPHFLFNTLNAIAELIHRDAPRAERTVTQLSDLLRISLQSGQEHEVTLREEIDFLRSYIAIHETLLEERLKVSWDVEDETLDALVPAMVLQPLVENAIRHGVGSRETGGTITIAAGRDGARLHLRVEDDGVGIGTAGPASAPAGIGLPNTLARLRHMYGDAHSADIREPAGGGFAVNITIPYRESMELPA